MIRLRRGIEEVYKTIGYQKKEDEEEYIYSPYLLFLDVPEGKVIYNTLTREAVLSQDTEEERDYLISRWYMLPEWFQPKSPAIYDPSDHEMQCSLPILLRMPSEKTVYEHENGKRCGRVY